MKDDRITMQDKRNAEKYSDPTAYKAMKHIAFTERELKKKSDRLIGAIKLFAEVAGFEIVGRICIRHKESGKEFR